MLHLGYMEMVHARAKIDNNYIFNSSKNSQEYNFSLLNSEILSLTNLQEYMLIVMNHHLTLVTFLGNSLFFKSIRKENLMIFFFVEWKKSPLP